MLETRFLLKRILPCLALLLVMAGSADALPYGYAYMRTITIDHTKVQAINGYSYYRSITIDHTKVGTVNNTDQTNFPVLISGTFNGSSGALDVRTAGNGGPIQNTTTLNGQTVPADLIFTSDASCATNLNWEVASYSASSGAMEAWVQVPTVSHSADTVIYVCYGKSSVSTYQGNATGTWDSHFKAVYHLPDGTTLSAKDSTGNANHATNTGVAATAGQIDGGGNLVGSQYLATPISTVFTAFTVCTWFKSSDDTGSQRIADKSYSGGFWMGHETTGAANKWGGGVHEASPPYGIYVTLANGSWHQLCSVLSGSTHYIYGDGGAASTSNSPASVSIDSSTLYFGEVTMGGGNGFNGQLDEIEVSDTARSLDWINTEYNNQNSPSSFYTIGAQTAGAISNFPVLIAGTYTYLKTGANGPPGQLQKTATLNGQTVPVDLIFTSDAAGTTLLNWEVASYSASTGAIEVWVKIPTLSAGTDTVIYMWYNNANIPATYLGNATSVWDANYKVVWHLANGTTLSGNDSTSNAFNAGFSATPPTATTGQIDGGGNFVAASSEFMSPGNDADMTTNDITLSGWINAPAANQFGAILSKKQVSGAFTGYTLGVGWYASNANMNTARTIFCDFYDGGTFTSTAHHQLYHTTSSIVDGSWHYVVCNRASGIVSIYVDKVSQALAADVAGTVNVNVSNANSLVSGFFDNNGAASYYNGKEDELRVSNIARSGDWITTEYNNQSSPTTFYTVGSESIAQRHAHGFMD